MKKLTKTTPQILLKADTVTLVARAEVGGMLRLTCAAWEDARVILPGQVLELRWQDGQIVAVKDDAIEDKLDLLRKIEALVVERQQLQQEIEYLRHYGNKDCTAMGDDALKRDRLAGLKCLFDVP